jgi:hypothetical protein
MFYDYRGEMDGETVSGCYCIYPVTQAGENLLDGVAIDLIAERTPRNDILVDAIQTLLDVMEGDGLDD